MTSQAAPLSSQDAIEELATVHTRIVDAVAGYRTMHEKADLGFKPTIERVLELHDRHGAELADLLARHGQTPDTDGSFLSKLHETAVKARAFFSDIDEDAAGQIILCEKWILEGYGEALEEGLAPEDASMIARHRGELQALIGDLRAMDT